MRQNIWAQRYQAETETKHYKGLLNDKPNNKYTQSRGWYYWLMFFILPSRSSSHRVSSGHRVSSHRVSSGHRVSSHRVSSGHRVRVFSAGGRFNTAVHNHHYAVTEEVQLRNEEGLL